MPDLVAFLGHVLPEAGGSIALGYGKGGPRSTRFCADMQAMVSAAVPLIMAGNDVYFTPARYTPRKRLAANCVAKRCIVLDVDLNHEDKPSYETHVEALLALLSVTDRLGFPAPSYVVNSGRGLHIYWALDADAKPEQWKAVATLFKQAIMAADPKLAPDTTRWADLAGYLRLVGSMNSKSGTICDFYTVDGKHVGTEETYKLSAFAPSVGTGVVIPDRLPKANLPKRNGVIDRVGSTLSTDKTENTTVPRPLELLEQCAPMAAMARSGKQSYEAWQGVARIMARAEDKDVGREAFDKFSENHKGYNADVAEAKFNDAVSTSFASPSCAQLRSWAGLNIEACRSCPLFIAQGENGKPAALQTEFIDAMDTGPTLPATLDEEVKALDRSRRSRQQGKFAPIELLGLKVPKVMFKEPQDRPGLFIDEDNGRMYAVVEVDLGKGQVGYENRLVARRPFWIESRISERDLGNVGMVFGARIVQVWKKEDGWEARFVTVPANELNAGAGTFLAALNTYGLDIEATDSRTAQFRILHNYVRKRINMIETSRAFEKETRFGWRSPEKPEERAFIVGDRRYMPGGKTLLVEQDTGAYDMNDKVEQSGSLNEAVKLTRKAMQHGLFPLRFLMLCALGAPLLHMTNVEGALVLISGTTGSGKSAAMSYCNSFFGSAKPGRLLASGTDTQKSIMHMIGVVSNLPAFIDETTLMKDDDMATTLLQISQGGENNRLEGSANRLRTRNRWQTIAIASANKDVTEIIRTQSFTAEAQRMRAIDLSTAATKGEVFYRHGTRQFMADVLVPSHKHHGLIGVHFIKHVLDNYEEVQREVQAIDVKLQGSDTLLAAKSGDAFRIWRAVVAVAIAAGRIGERLGYWDMAQGFLDDVLNQLVVAAASLKERSAVDPSNYVRDFLYVNQAAVSIETIRNADGTPVEINGYAALPPLSRDGKPASASDSKISHTPPRTSVARLSLTEGATEAVCSMAEVTFRRFCRENALEFTYVLSKLKDDGSLLDQKERIQLSKGSPLPSMPMTVSTVGGDSLPATRTLSVRFDLRTPYAIGQPPEYL
ncbi:MAG: DUF927 domain-containing protein [Jhaorihella sp.]